MERDLQKVDKSEEKTIFSNPNWLARSEELGKTVHKAEDDVTGHQS